MNAFTIPIRDDDEPIAPPVKDAPVALDPMSDVLIGGLKIHDVTNTRR